MQNPPPNGNRSFYHAYKMGQYNNGKISPKEHTKTEDFALVMPTFIRRKLAKNPMLLSSLALTQENIATSFSRPWKKRKETLYSKYQL